MRNVLLLFTVLCFGLNSFSQSAYKLLKGRIEIKEQKAPLQGASVSALHLSDSLNVQTTLSDSTGAFQLRLDTGAYRLSITHTNFLSLDTIVYLNTDSLVYNIGIISMHRDYSIMPVVTVINHDRIRFSGDTLTYTASSFAVKPNATAHDLVRRLPGFKADGSGLEIQGQQIQRVYVDGREYFGKEVILALNNLDADMIAQVEVFDDDGEVAGSSGVGDGDRSKAVNIKLNKSTKNTWRGKVYAGFGPENKYNAGARTNMFSKKSQFALFASANNINRNSGDNGSTTGAASDKTGLNTAYSAGTNYSASLGKRLELTSSYFYNNTSGLYTKILRRHTALTDCALLTTINSSQNRRTEAHRANVKITYKPNKYNKISLSSNLIRDQSEVINQDTITDYIAGAGNDTHRSTQRTNTNAGNSWNNINEFVWLRTFKREGRALLIHYRFIANRAIRDGANNASTSIPDVYSQTNETKISSLFAFNRLSSDKHNVSLSFTEPLGGRSGIQARYVYSSAVSVSERQTKAPDPNTGKFSSVDSLSDFLTYKTEIHRPELSYKYKGNALRYQVGMAVQKLFLSAAVFENVPVRQSHIAFIPSAMLQFGSSDRKHVTFLYRGQNNPPNALQTQEIPDLSDYPYIRKGNSRLRDEFTHNVVLTFNKLNRKNFSNLFFSLYLNTTQDKISNSLSYDGELQTISPVNLNGNINSSISVNYSFPLKSLPSSTLSFTTRAGISRNPGLVNGKKNFVVTSSGGEEIGFTNQFGENLYMEFTGSLTYSAAKNSAAQGENRIYFLHEYSLNLDYSFGSGFILSSEILFNNSSASAVDNNRSRILWNVRMSYEFLRSRRAEVTILCNNLLNNDFTFYRNTYENTIEDIQENTLGRFFMLQIAYNLKRGRADNR